MNGIWGTLAIGIFATENGVTGLVAGNAGQIVAQLIGVAAVGVWCLATGGVLFFGILRGWLGLRVSREEEIKGLDIEEHGTQAYPADTVPAWGSAD
jgi:Amt family ammonium transporter